MPNPRLPTELAVITGATKVNPKRHSGRSSPKVKSLGKAPKKFSDDQAVIWDEFNDEFPWLGRSDRRIVGLAVLLQSEIDDPATDTPVAVLAQMRMLLGSLGGTPADRSKVSAPDDEAVDPADEFLN